jgi:MFS family permease
VRRQLHYAWIVLAAGTLVVFGALGLARFGYTMVLPAMQAALRLDNAQAGGLATANLVGYLALALIGGALASRYGPRLVITAGLVVGAIGMALTGAATSFAGAACWRMLTGVGSGASNVPVMGLMSAWFSPRRRGLAAGIAVTGSSLALIALGPIVPGILTLYRADGWRACWFLFAAATGGLAILAVLVLRNRPSSLGLRPLGEASDGTPAPAPSDRMPWSTVYRSGIMWHVGLVYAAFGFSYIIYMTFFAKYLIAEGGYAPPAAGRLFMLMGWASLLCGLLWGAISDAIGRKAAMAIVYVVQAVAFGLFALWPTPQGFTLSAILFGLTAWSIPAIVAAVSGDLLGPRLAPAGLGFVTLFFGIGQAAGPSVAGLLADTTRSFQPAFLLAAGVAVMGAIGSLLLRPRAYVKGL